MPQESSRGRHLTDNEPEGYYQELEPAVNVLSFRDLWVRYSDRFMKAEVARKKKIQKLERRRFRKADRHAGKVDADGYYTTLAAIALRAGEGYNYLKNLRSKKCTVNPCRERVIRLAKAIEATPNETKLLLRAAGHSA